MTRDEIAEINPEALFLTEPEYDAALLGVVSRCAFSPVALYDREKIIDILVAGGLEYEQAEEHYEFNIAGSYVGEHGPLFLSRSGEGGLFEVASASASALQLAATTFREARAAERAAVREATAAADKSIDEHKAALAACGAARRVRRDAEDLLLAAAERDPE